MAGTAKPKKKNAAKKEAQIISRTMTLGEVAEKYPAALPIIMSYGLHCIGCHVAQFETVEQGLLAHGLSEKDVDTAVRKMNDAVRKQKRP